MEAVGKITTEFESLEEIKIIGDFICACVQEGRSQFPNEANAPEDAQVLMQYLTSLLSSFCDLRDVVEQNETLQKLQENVAAAVRERDWEGYAAAQERYETAADAARMQDDGVLDMIRNAVINRPGGVEMLTTLAMNNMPVENLRVLYAEAELDCLETNAEIARLAQQNTLLEEQLAAAIKQNQDAAKGEPAADVNVAGDGKTAAEALQEKIKAERAAMMRAKPKRPNKRNYNRDGVLGGGVVKMTGIY